MSMSWITAASDIWTSCFRAGVRSVYPDKCALCDRVGEPAICSSCRNEFVPDHRGLIAGTPADPFSFRVHSYRYEGRAAQAVRRLKYDRATSLATPMSHMLAEAKDRHDASFPPDTVVVPIPIHWTRLRQRGFNQSALLAESLAAVDAALLRRSKATSPQVGLTRSERMKNLAGAFAASPLAKGKNILLVDDVFTSGTTAGECARTLIAAGAASVAVLTFCGEAEPVAG